MGVQSALKTILGNSEASNTDYNALDNKPQINGVALSGNKTSSQLGLAPEGYGNDSIWSVNLETDDTGTDYKVVLKGMTKDGTIKDNISVPLPFNKLIKKIELVDASNGKSNTTQMVIPTGINRVWEVMTENNDGKYAFKHQKGSWLIYETEGANKNVLSKNPYFVLPEWYKTIASGYILRVTYFDNTTEDIDLSGLFADYVLKTTQIAGIEIQDGITGTELAEALKNEAVILSNKGINADTNDITNIEVENFKDTAISKEISKTDASDNKLTTEKAVYDYFENNTIKGIRFQKFVKDRIILTLTDKNGNTIVSSQVSDVCFCSETQTLTNKTISTENNTILLRTDKANLTNGSLMAIEDDKLYVKNYNGDLICLNDKYKINDLIIPATLSNNQLKTDETITTELKDGNIEIKLPYAVKVMSYVEYQAITPKENYIYFIKDYPSKDIIEDREMVNNRWVITRTDSELPLLTFIQNGVVHNKNVYYTKAEINQLLDYKEDVLNGAGATIAHDNLEAGKILVSNDEGKIVASSYPTECLESIGLQLVPSVTLSTAGNYYLDNIACKGYVVNKTDNAYRVDLTFKIHSVCPTWNQGAIAVITMPEGFEVNYDATKQLGFQIQLCRMTSGTSYDVANGIARYTSNKTIQLLLPQSTILKETGMLTASINLF